MTDKKIIKRLILTLFIGAPVFLFFIPYLVYSGGKYFDSLIGFAPVFRTKLWFIFAVLAGLFGIVFSLWSVFYILFVGKGTPLSVSPKGGLLTSGPYSYSRNPMGFGVLTLYFSIAIFSKSLSAFLIVVVLSAIFLLYIVTVEEKNLEESFGEEYVIYKKQVPRLIPKPRCPFKTKIEK